MTIHPPVQYLRSITLECVPDLYSNNGPRSEAPGSAQRTRADSKTLSSLHQIRVIHSREQKIKKIDPQESYNGRLQLKKEKFNYQHLEPDFP